MKSIQKIDKYFKHYIRSCCPRNIVATATIAMEL